MCACVRVMQVWGGVGEGGWLAAHVNVSAYVVQCVGNGSDLLNVAESDTKLQ